MPQPRRQKVVTAFILLVVTMIVTNLILLTVYAGWALEAQQNPSTANHTYWKSKPREYTSIRFVRHGNGQTFLFTPEALNEAQIFSVVHRIEISLQRKSESLLSRTVHGVIRLEGRLRRELEKSLLETPKKYSEPERIWKSIRDWPVTTQLKTSLGQIIRFTSQVEILQAMNTRRGTQLKIELVLAGGQLAIFKPKWYDKDFVVHGDVYGGKDRHFGEIASFYLNQLLGFNAAPLTMGRRIDLLKEIMPIATEGLKGTFFYNQTTDLCFYGICYYCKPEDFVCAEGVELDGALILILSQKIRTIPNPWRRTYKKGVFAPWELNQTTFCQDLNMKASYDMSLAEQEEFVLDLVAVSVFDFLIGNGDRHHLEMFADKENVMSGHSKSILLIDNGKSFGNPYEDYIDILAPLFQCCKIRKSLWNTLSKFRGRLGSSLNSVTSFDPLYPLLAKEHLAALDQRLEMIFATVQVCMEMNSDSNVIV